MKILTLLILLLFSTSIGNAQANWISKEVGSRIFVKFPVEPSYQLKDKTGIYTSKTDKNVFMVMVQYDAIPFYSDFLEFSKEQQDKLAGIYLDSAIQGIITASGNIGIPYTSINLGQYSGRETSFSSVNPVTGNLGKGYFKIFYSYNKMFMFCCFSFQDTENSEVNLFYNSISIK